MLSLSHGCLQVLQNKSTETSFVLKEKEFVIAVGLRLAKKESGFRSDSHVTANTSMLVEIKSMNTLEVQGNEAPILTSTPQSTLWTKLNSFIHKTTEMEETARIWTMFTQSNMENK